MIKSSLKNLRLLWVFLFFCLATFLITYPLGIHLATSIVGGMGDNIYFVWLIHWYQSVFIGGNWHPFFNPWMNYPQGWNLSTTDTTLASALPGVPVSLLFGPIAGYNFAMLLTFVLSGFFMYLWVRNLTRSDAASLLAGTIYAFSPNHMAQFVAGHLNLCGLEWFPLYFWGLYDLLRAGKHMDWRAVLLTALGLAAIGFTSMYYLYMTLIFSFIFILAYLIFTKFRALRDGRFWIRSLVAGILSLPFLYFCLKPFMSLSNAGGIASRSLTYAGMYSASPTDFVFPSAIQFFLGSTFSRIFDRSLWIEGSFYIGIIAFILCLIAFVMHKKSPHRWLIWTSLVVILSSVILGLGVNLHWNNQDVIWRIPVFLQPLFHKSQTLIYLPASWLFLHLPFYNKMRALIRFGGFVLIFTPVLAGLGFDQIRQKLSPTKAKVLALVLILLVLAEFYPGQYARVLTQPQPRPVDLWLAKQPNEGAVVQMPFESSSDQSQLYYTLFYTKPFLGGFFNANQPEQYQDIQPIMDGFPDMNSFQLLQKLKVKYIVVNSAAYKDFAALDQKCTKLGLVKLTTQANQVVYTFPAP